MSSLLMLWSLAVVSLCHSVEFMQSIGPGEHVRYTEVFHHHAKFVFQITPMNDTKYELSVILSNDFMFPYYKNQTDFGRVSIKLSRMAPTSNKYEFNVVNQGDQEVFFRIRLSQGAQVQDYTTLPGSDEHSMLELQVNQLEKHKEHLSQSMGNSEAFRVHTGQAVDTLSGRTSMLAIMSGVVVVGLNSAFFKWFYSAIRQRKMA